MYRPHGREALKKSLGYPNRKLHLVFSGNTEVFGEQTQTFWNLSWLEDHSSGLHKQRQHTSICHTWTGSWGFLGMMYNFCHCFVQTGKVMQNLYLSSHVCCKSFLLSLKRFIKYPSFLILISIINHNSGRIHFNDIICLGKLLFLLKEQALVLVIYCSA